MSVTSSATCAAGARNFLPTLSAGVSKLVVSCTPGKRVAIATTSSQVGIEREATADPAVRPSPGRLQAQAVTTTVIATFHGSRTTKPRSAGSTA